ncbi:MAG: Holliday junction branch migration protein RuvA [Synechococcus sp. SB0673_bin_10]|nr:Holliday junction branch migration protein RuvA [Synechococcus sp. SB0678_bin_12]MYI71636.1 Holliday junction branch migration protein RuvA [Synechococcus sp. SB0673_bin_10]MYI87745.1 Holliday junction branch migration protein RuvA [Synechococcus sp. SB0672_bin_10]
MIGWLEGEVRQFWQRGARQGVLLVCQGVGYEVVLHQRFHSHVRGLPQRSDAPRQLALFTHLQVRDDGWLLFGFETDAERELFRELISVSGIGPQLALGLLGFFPLPELVQALVQADLKRLSQAPGVGRRSAERLAVELRRKLAERFGQAEEVALMDAAPLPTGALRQDVELTLTALGYEPGEVHQALAAVAVDQDAKSQDAGSSEDWIRGCLRWLACRQQGHG